MAFLVNETVDNIDKILECMKKCIKGGMSDVEKVGPIDLVDFASYSKMFFREINSGLRIFVLFLKGLRLWFYRPLQYLRLVV